MQEPAAAAATVVVRPVGMHLDEVFFAHERSDHETQVFGDGVAITLANDLAWILNRKLDFQIFVPIGIDLQLAFTDPPGVVLIDVFDFKVMFEVELFQSGPD